MGGYLAERMIPRIWHVRCFETRSETAPNWLCEKVHEHRRRLDSAVGLSCLPSKLAGKHITCHIFADMAREVDILSSFSFNLCFVLPLALLSSETGSWPSMMSSSFYFPVISSMVLLLCLPPSLYITARHRQTGRETQRRYGTANQQNSPAITSSPCRVWQAGDVARRSSTPLSGSTTVALRHSPTQHEGRLALLSPVVQWTISSSDGGRHSCRTLASPTATVALVIPMDSKIATPLASIPLDHLPITRAKQATPSPSHRHIHPGRGPKHGKHDLSN